MGKTTKTLQGSRPSTPTSNQQQLHDRQEVRDPCAAGLSQEMGPASDDIRGLLRTIVDRLEILETSDRQDVHDAGAAGTSQVMGPGPDDIRGLLQSIADRLTVLESRNHGNQLAELPPTDTGRTGGTPMLNAADVQHSVLTQDITRATTGLSNSLQHPVGNTPMPHTFLSMPFLHQPTPYLRPSQGTSCSAVMGLGMHSPSQLTRLKAPPLKYYTDEPLQVAPVWPRPSIREPTITPSHQGGRKHSARTRSKRGRYKAKNAVRWNFPSCRPGQNSQPAVGVANFRGSSTAPGQHSDPTSGPTNHNSRPTRSCVHFGECY